MSKPAKQVSDYIEKLLLQNPAFTGKLELNFKFGNLKDVNETKRTKIEGE